MTIELQINECILNFFNFLWFLYKLLNIHVLSSLTCVYLQRKQNES